VRGRPRRSTAQLTLLRELLVIRLPPKGSTGEARASMWLARDLEDRDCTHYELRYVEDGLQQRYPLTAEAFDALLSADHSHSG